MVPRDRAGRADFYLDVVCVRTERLLLPARRHYNVVIERRGLFARFADRTS